MSGRDVIGRIDAIEEGDSYWRSFGDLWTAIGAAKPYRILTCASKTVEAALALGGLVKQSYQELKKLHLQ